MLRITFMWEQMVKAAGIVFNGKNGTVYGDVTLQEDLEIAEGETLTIGEDASLTVPEGTTLTNNGTLTNTAPLRWKKEVPAPTMVPWTATIISAGRLPAPRRQRATSAVQNTGISSPTADQDRGQGTHLYRSGQWRHTGLAEAAVNTSAMPAAIPKLQRIPGCLAQSVTIGWIAVYTWSDDGSTCTATRTCKHDSTHTETSKATVTAAQTKAPTCTQMGETTYTAAFEADWAMTQTKVMLTFRPPGTS